MTEQTERTAAQERWASRSTHYIEGQIGVAYERAEEVAATVAALAAEVAELRTRVDVHKSGIEWCHEHVTALEQPATAALAPDPVCQCGHGQGHHMGKTEFCTAITRTFHDERSDQTCECRKFVPTADPVGYECMDGYVFPPNRTTADPAPLDPVLAGKAWSRARQLLSPFEDGDREPTSAALDAVASAIVDDVIAMITAGQPS